jgi:hypothetical protein
MLRQEYFAMMPQRMRASAPRQNAAERRFLQRRLASLSAG